MNQAIKGFTISENYVEDVTSEVRVEKRSMLISVSLNNQPKRFLREVHS